MHACMCGRQYRVGGSLPAACASSISPNTFADPSSRSRNLQDTNYSTNGVWHSSQRDLAKNLQQTVGWRGL